MTQETFEMLVKYYPVGMKIFNSWFKSEYPDRQYLSLPTACQIGIWIEFCLSGILDLDEGWVVELTSMDWELDMITTIRALNTEEDESDN